METRRLVLCPLVIEDVGAMLRNWTSNPQVTKLLSWEPRKNVEGTKKILRGWVASYEFKDFYTRVIAWRGDEGNVIGGITVSRLNQKAGRAMVGYYLSRKWWGNGAMKGAFTELVRFFFEIEGASRVGALYDTHNVNSGKVMMAYGFKKEGALR